jgi:hypothetical protein
MRRLALLALVAGGAIGTISGLATASKPTPGEWNAAHAHFTVNAAMTRITGFSSKCAGVPLPLKMKIKSDGTFSYKRKKALMGGAPLTEKVRGKFVSATKATGSASYGRCHEKFTAKTKAAVTPSTPTDTTTTDSVPTDTTSPY